MQQPVQIPVSEPTNIVQYFDIHSRDWDPRVQQYVLALFGALLLFEVAVTFFELLKKKADSEDVIHEAMWLAMTRGLWLTLLTFGTVWMMDIVNSFTYLAFLMTGQQPVTPSSVLATGYNVVTALLTTASVRGAMFDMATMAGFFVAGIACAAAYIWLAKNYVVFWAETYLCVRIGYPFLGFGGCRWTQPYAERYFTLAIACGVRLAVITIIIALGTSFTIQWFEPMAAHAPYSPAGVITSWKVAACAIIFAAIAHEVPSFFAGIISGAPTLSGSHITAVTQPVVQAGIATATIAGNAVINSAAGTAKAGAAALSGGSGIINSKP